MLRFVYLPLLFLSFPLYAQPSETVEQVQKEHTHDNADLHKRLQIAEEKVRALEADPSDPKLYCDRACVEETIYRRRGVKLAGYHRGKFFVRDASNRFRLSPGLRLQVDGNSYAPTFGESGPRSSFFIRRARIEVRAGFFQERFNVHLSGEFARKSGPIAADAWIRWNAHPWFLVTTGLFSSPFSMENLVSDTLIDFMERSATVRNLSLASKAVGVMASGAAPDQLFTYRLALLNGDGTEVRNADGAFDVVGRATVQPLSQGKGVLKRLRAGTSFSASTRKNTDVPSLGGHHGSGSWWRTSTGYSLLSLSYNAPDGTGIDLVPTDLGIRIGGDIDVPLDRFFARAEYIHYRTDVQDVISASGTLARGGELSANGAYLTLGYWVVGNREGALGLEKIPRGGKVKGGSQIPLVEEVVPAIATPEPRLQLILRGEYNTAKFTPGAQSGAVALNDSGLVGEYEWVAASVGANLWWTRHVRFTTNYTINVLEENPNLKLSDDILHEFAMRTALQF